jgi:cytochrome c
MRCAADYRWGAGMKLVLLLLTAVSTVGAASAQTAQDLLQHYKCYTCHADNEPKAGPAWVDVAAKYAGNRQAITIISGFVRKGAHGSAPWHMPPHPEISAADANTMARYILSRVPSGVEKKN